MERLRNLENNGVFIYTAIEHYAMGSNLNFSIVFRNENLQTGWYGDSHEFGDVARAMDCAVKLAQWHLDNPRMLETINKTIFTQDERIRGLIEEKQRFIRSLYEKNN